MSLLGGRRAERGGELQSGGVFAGDRGGEGSFLWGPSRSRVRALDFQSNAKGFE